MHQLLLCLCLLSPCFLVMGKWVEGHLDTKDNWAFLARFCFLSLEGQFEYSIEFDSQLGTPNLLLYYDDESQWPSVYHSEKSCKEREAVLNKAGQNQIIPLSHWYPDVEFSGCVLRNRDHELPATKTKKFNKTTTTKLAPIPTKPTPLKPTPATRTSRKPTQDPTYYHQFLQPTGTTTDTNVTWFEITEDNETTTEPTELWESIGPGNESKADLKDVEILFGKTDLRSHHEIKRSTFEISERMKRRRLTTGATGGVGASTAPTRLVVTCYNSRRFRSARERWWFIAISNCDSPKGLNVQYRFLMTNGPEGDFWHSHFSADEFYVFPVLIAYMLAYVLVLIAVVMCSVELKTRHLLHTTYKLFVISVAVQHSGIILMSLAYARYAVNGVGSEGAKTVGQFLTGVSEMTFLLVLVLMAKGYTITRARLKLSFTVRLTVFMCCYVVTYVLLFVYQAKSFDPGAVLYLYESPAGYGLVVLRIAAWFMFVYATVFTVKKFPEKSMFYCPFSICGTLWFFAGPLFILTANSYVDKWVRESVVNAVLLFISFAGHISFLLLTLPVFANKNFPYHVRTTQIGIMEVAGNGVDSFTRGMYRPTEVTTAQTVIIPLTRRTEELIGSIYSQYMATAPPMSLEDENHPRTNGIPKNTPRPLVQQDSTETNTSSDIRPTIGSFPLLNGKTLNGTAPKDEDSITDKPNGNIASEVRPTNGIISIGSLKNGQATSDSSKNSSSSQPNSGSFNISKDGVFSIETQMAKIRSDSQENSLQNGYNSLESQVVPPPKPLRDVSNPILMSANSKARRNLLEPLGLNIPPPTWSLAKGPVGQKKTDEKKVAADKDPSEQSFSVTVTRKSSNRSLHRQASDISTIHEQYEQLTDPIASNTVDLFTVGRNK